MPPSKPLPFSDVWSSPDAYIEALADFVSTSKTFQILCGGVHIVDFFTIGPGQFHAALPQEWHHFLLSREPMEFVDFLARQDLDGDKLSAAYPSDAAEQQQQQPPQSLVDYVRTVRNLSLQRDYAPSRTEDHPLPQLPKSVAVGMKTKKKHEVANFASFVEGLSADIKSSTGDEISHYVDFGSGQNYLGRALASEPYSRNVVAVEGREHNVSAARALDLTSGLLLKPQVMRNKKMWNRIRELQKTLGDDPESLTKAVKEVAGADAFEFRATQDLGLKLKPQGDRELIQYISGRLDSGDLADVIANIDRSYESEEQKKELKLMAISIHSCGNLSHYGIRSLLMNEDIRAIAIVGCCYNLLTERLGPPTYKHPYLRPTLQAVNQPTIRHIEQNDPQGFPMSERFTTYRGEGVRLNITARMMACQALANWSEDDSDGFFTRHFYRAIMQKLFLDRGVVDLIRHRKPEEGEEPSTPSLFDMSTNPVAIGTLSKKSYSDFNSYVRGAVRKLSTSSEYKKYAHVMEDKMSNLTDEEIDGYLQTYLPRKRELSVVWSLMAFSAIVVESLIVADRWSFLREHDDVVGQAWVETVFDYKQSPRNLVVVGIKK